MQTISWRVPSLCCAMLALACCLGTRPVGAGQIVPQHVDSPNGFGPFRPAPPGCTVEFEAIGVQAIRCLVPVPAGTVQIVGWSGYALDLYPFSKDEQGQSPLSPAGYLSIEIFHDGGVEHRLSQPHWPGGTLTLPTGVFTLPDVFYPAGDGHDCKVGDEVYGIFWCVGLPPWHQMPWCTMSLTIHYRLGH